MNGLLDNSLVGVVLCAGFGYAIYALGPKSLRARLLTGSAALLGRFPAAGVRALAQRMAAAAGKAKGSCGGCDNCGSNEAASDRSSAPGAAPQEGAENGPGNASEIRIPLAKIGKRRSARGR